ncbi:MAG: lysophospholipase [Bacteroidales bacterium]|nr:lysophospholipase [Bacteroidales bacterium]
MNHFETNWKSFDGLDMVARGWTPTDTSPKAVVCLVHGVGEHTLRYANVAEAFTKEGYILFGADLRGHGKSAGPRGHFPNIEVVQRDIDLLLDQARQRFPSLPLILYGHSLGAVLVLHYGLKQKPDVQGVIATSPALHNALEHQQVKVMGAKVLGSVFPTMTIHSDLDVGALSHDDEVGKAYNNDPLVNDQISLGFGKIMLGVAQWTLEHAGEFSLPLLIMHGKADTIALPSSSIEFAANLDGNCKLVLWEDAYHELHNETNKVEVLKTMTDWIGAHLS